MGGQEKVRQSFAKDGLDWILDLGNLGEDSDEDVEEMTNAGQLLSRKQKMQQQTKRISVEPGGKAKRRKLPEPSESSEASDSFAESSQESLKKEDAESPEESEKGDEESEDGGDTEEQREAKRQALLASRKGLPAEIVRLLRGQINRMAESNVLGVARELVKVIWPNALAVRHLQPPGPQRRDLPHHSLPVQHAKQCCQVDCCQRSSDRSPN